MLLVSACCCIGHVFILWQKAAALVSKCALCTRERDAPSWQNLDSQPRPAPQHVAMILNCICMKIMQVQTDLVELGDQPIMQWLGARLTGSGQFSSFQVQTQRVQTVWCTSAPPTLPTWVGRYKVQLLSPQILNSIYSRCLYLSSLL